MLDTDTKRRIDTARDILVGKVPDPKSQVEQITIALIYKFMDDMDAESEELGGKRTFFAGEYVKYGWAKLMAVGIEGFEMLGLYAEGIARMPENMGIPQLFRDIFKNAYLPYRDPETLKSFLKIINEFSYDHSERLGDAFEYLLSVLGSQGDAGQFRTPRHIIDFMVEVMQPQLGEVVLDPACGTAGFLISAYKHILENNKDAKGVSTLTPNSRKKLAANFKGYDISPDMVRLSRANLYLHGFLEPQIAEYDTLTSDDKWNESADVILANPPFMSPKGGIKPHKRFSIQAKRSEVLFVDYIAEHLSPQGRAAIIVPEGIIFQSQGAYKDLRKMLVENSLVAVISLPAGVFQPYSGVKTSILILDKTLAKQAEGIAFFKIENDGFGLGAQRRAIAKNDLPNVEKALGQYLQGLRANNGLQALSDMASEHGMVVSKDKIALSGDYNLSGERYREGAVSTSSFPIVALADVILGTPQYGSGASKIEFDGKVRYVRITDLTNDGRLKNENAVSPSTVEADCFLEVGDLLIARSGSVGRAYLHQVLNGIHQYAGYLIRFRIDPDKALPEFIFHVTQSALWWAWIESNSKTGTLTNINAKQYASFQFPLPPLDIQKQIVAEIEGYQKVIDGARAVVDNYRPRIDVQADWPMVALGTLVSTSSGGTPSKNDPALWVGDVPWVSPKDMKVDFIEDTEDHISELAVSQSATKLIGINTLLCVVRSGILQHTFPVALTRRSMCFNQDIVAIQSTSSDLDVRYLFYTFKSNNAEILKEGIKPGVTVQSFHSGFFKSYQLPLPPLPIQQSIVAEIEAEQALVAANRELIVRFEKKIAAVLARVWGEAA